MGFCAVGSRLIEYGEEGLSGCNFVFSLECDAADPWRCCWCRFAQTGSN